MLPETMYWNSAIPLLSLLDQTKIPHAVEHVDCRTYEEVALAIENMIVRGAPAIGVAAAYGVALAAAKSPQCVEEAIRRLGATRPTAVNLFWSLKQMESVAAAATPESLFHDLEAQAICIHKEDLLINRAIGEYGQQLLPDKCSVITHCNAGALATAGYGTALGVFRAARKKRKKLRIFADETRPRLQGALLTAWELMQDDFDVTVITDSMAAFLMQRESIDAVITGADRIAVNGDTANKIGTYGLALSAFYHKVPFYIAAPLSTIDPYLTDGGGIPIEERNPDEVRFSCGARILSSDTAVWNPAFDVTPASLITAIITEKGILYPPYSHAIKEVFQL